MTFDHLSNHELEKLISKGDAAKAELKLRLAKKTRQDNGRLQRRTDDIVWQGDTDHEQD